MLIQRKSVILCQDNLNDNHQTLQLQKIQGMVYNNQVPYIS